MLTADAIKHFKKKRELAAAAGVQPQSIYSWGETVPEGRAARLHKATRGKLKYDPKFYENK